MLNNMRCLKASSSQLNLLASPTSKALLLLTPVTLHMIGKEISSSGLDENRAKEKEFQLVLVFNKNTLLARFFPFLTLPSGLGVLVL